MNCPSCGAILPQGAQTCPACGTFLANGQPFSGYAPQSGGYSQGFDPTAYGYQQGYPQASYGQGGFPQGYDASAYGQQGGYSQGFDPTAYGYTQAGYPQGYQPVVNSYRPSAGEHNAFITALSYLPRVIAGVVRNPGDTLQAMMERNDIYTGGVVAGLSLLFTFLAAILMMRGTISSLLGGFAGLTGASVAGSQASMNQGVNYIAGRMGASVGGIAALCQLIAVALPAAVALVYLCAVRKVRFSFLLASNLVAITTLPSIAAALLCMLLSLLTPFAGLLALLLGEIASYVFLGALIVRITGLPETYAVPTKIAVFGIAEVLKIVLIQLVGGALMSMAMQTASSLITNLGSLL